MFIVIVLKDEIIVLTLFARPISQILQVYEMTYSTVNFVQYFNEEPRKEKYN